jgi:hypothetical protein
LGYDAAVLRQTLFLLVALCAVTLVPAGSWAKENGFPSDSCSGCHRGGSPFTPRITIEPARVEPGQTVVLSVHIPAENGPAAGLFLNANNKGSFTEIPGEGMRKTASTQATHTAPKTAQGAETTFRIRWTAPDEPGGVEFDVNAVSANRNGGSSGDSEGTFRLNLSYGCEGADGYLDQDGDGFGIPDLRGPSRFCELPSNYAAKGGDCNDYDRQTNPAGVEICNSFDDNCDGRINEGLENVMVYRDEDGDGHGGRLGEMKLGCGSGFGFSSTRDDCDDTNREVHPGVKEICNARDDDCNGRADDGARAACGQGWCRRLAPTCDPASCVAGPPRAEACNAFDDDCDGVLDNGPNLCAEGRMCQGGFCFTPQEVAEIAASQPDGGASRPDGGVAGPVGGAAGGGGGMPGGGVPIGTGNGDAGERPATLPKEPSEPVEAARPRLGCAMSGEEAGGGSRDGSTAVLAALVLLLAGGRAVRRRRA